jgi:hypothetical protein
MDECFFILLAYSAILYSKKHFCNTIFKNTSAILYSKTILEPLGNTRFKLIPSLQI